MLMLKTTHDRIVAERASAHAAAAGRAQAYAGLLRDARLSNARLNDECDALAAKVARLETRLAPFIAERKRNAKGHFVSSKGAQA